MQNFLALNINTGIYIDDIRKHDKPEPKQTAKYISLWVADNLNVNLFQKLGPLVVVSSFIKDLKEYCELNMALFDININYSDPEYYINRIIISKVFCITLW